MKAALHTVRTLALAASAVAVAGDALAADRSAGVRLSYVDHSSASCPSQADVQAAAVSRLGYDPFSPSGTVVVSVTIAPVTGRGLRADIRIEDPTREAVATRAIGSASGDCDELGKAVALAISIAIDAMGIGPVATMPSTQDLGSTPTPRAPGRAGPRGSGTDPQEKPLVPPAVEPELLGDGSLASDVARRPGAPSAQPPSEGPSWQLSLHTLTSVGFTPGVTVGGALAGGWIGHNQSLEIEGRADLPQSTGHGTGSISVWPLLFTVAPCVNVRGWAVCGLGRVGTLHGSGKGFAVNTSGSSLLATIGARLANEAILSKRLGFRVFFDLDWLATSNSFDVDRRSAWVVSAWAVSLGFGLTTRFP